jgi:hypothetical protein
VLRPLWFDARVACLRKGYRALTLYWPMKNPPAIGRRALSGAGLLGADVSYAWIGVLVRAACIALGRTMSTAACTSTIAVAVSSVVIAGVASVTTTAAVFATAMVAGPVPSGVSSVAGFCDSERTLNMGQACETEIEMEDHWTANGDH